MENSMGSKIDIKPKKTLTKTKKKNQEQKKNITPFLMIEKEDNLNKSQRLFIHSPRIKVGQR